MHQCHVLHRPACDFTAAGKTELFSNKVCPARPVGKIGTALRCSAYGEALRPAGSISILRRNRRTGQNKANCSGSGDFIELHGDLHYVFHFSVKVG